MAFFVSRPDSVQFGNYIAQYAIDVGKLEQNVVIMENNIDVQNKQSIAEGLCFLFEGVRQRREEIEELVKQAGKVDDLAVPIFKAQIAQTYNTLESATTTANHLFNLVIEKRYKKLRNQTDFALEQLIAHRNDPSQENLRKVKRALLPLKGNIRYIRTLTQGCHLDFHKNEKQLLNVYLDMANRLKTLIRSQEANEFGDLFNRLNAACKGKITSSQIISLRDVFRRFFRTINKDFESALNTDLSSLFEEEKQQAWAKTLKRAFCRVLQFELDKILIQFKDPEEFYRLVHEMAFGPETANPTAWVKSNLPSLLLLAQKVAHQVLPQANTQAIEKEEGSSSGDEKENRLPPGCGHPDNIDFEF